MRNKYLFIMSPPYSGSTVLWRLLQTSSNVSALPDEGQKLPELRDMMRDDPWNPRREFDWERIEQVWHRHWNLAYPVLLEKSPPHLCRAAVLDVRFQPAWHILLLRDPMASCEALHRRNGWDWDVGARRWLQWLQWHLECRRTLKRIQIVYYEDMVDPLTEVFARLATWLPELADVDTGASVTSHAIDGVIDRPLTDLNPDKLLRVSEAARNQVRKVLATAPELLAETRYAERYL